MWVNKEFISRLNEMLISTADERSPIDLSGFDIYKAKKYQATIESLKKFNVDQQEIRSEINDILEEKYYVESVGNDEIAPDIFKLKTINQNLKNLVHDLQKTSIALTSQDYNILLPSRGDHQALRDSFNKSLRSVSTHVSNLNLEIDQKGKELNQCRKTIQNREQYLGELTKAVNDISFGNDSIEVPWSDQDKELFKAIQGTRAVMRGTIRFLGDLSQGIPAAEKIPCSPDSQLGAVLTEVAESCQLLSRKAAQSDQLIRRLEQKNSELNQFIELVTYYIEGIAIGDYTQHVPFKEDQPVLVAALEQVKMSFEEISTAAMEAAKGDLNRKEILPEHHGLVRSAFQQMLQSFKTRQNQLMELIKDKTTQVEEGQNQLRDLLDYNLRFEKQYEDLSAQYEQTINEQLEQNRVVDRLQKKNDRLEDEVKSLKQKLASQTKLVKGLEQGKDQLQESNKRQSLFVKSVMGDLNRHLNKINSLAESEQKKAEASKSPLSPIFRQLGKKTTDVRDTISRTFEELEGMKQAACAEEIELQLFVRELQLDLKEIEIEFGNEIRFNIEETAPRTFFSDDVRLKYILRALSKHGLKHSKTAEVVCRIFRAASDTKPGASQPMVGFEIQVNSALPLSGQQLVLEAFEGFYDLHRDDWDDVNLGLALLRELTGAINGELHLHSIQGGIDTYLVLIPLNIGALKEESPALVASMPENGDNVIFVLEDDTRFMNSVASGFEPGGFKCLQLDSLEEAVEQARQNLPYCVCLGMKWIGSQGRESMKTISKMSNGNKVPFVALTETAKVPDEWKDCCIGFLEKTAGTNQYQTMLERMKAYRKNYLPNLAILAQQDELNVRIDTFINNFSLESEVIVDPDSPADSVKKSHLLVMSNGETPSVDVAEKLVNQYRRKCPNLSVISGTTGGSAYQFRSRLEPVSDAFVEIDRIEDDLLYELIRLLQLSDDQSVKDRQQSMTEYLNIRNELLKDKNALMITENAASTMGLRKQLNQLGLVIRVNTKLNKIIEGLSAQSRCDLVIINAVKSEYDKVRIVKEIRQSKDYSHLPILLMSDSTQLGDEEYWREKGVSYFLPNSAEFDELLSAIRVSIGSQLLV